MLITKNFLRKHPYVIENEDCEFYYIDCAIPIAIHDEENGDEHLDLVPEAMLSILLANDMLIVNSFWWKDSWSTEDQKLTYFGVNCSDFFGPAADAEGINFYDIPDVFWYFLKDPVWGTRIWSAKKRGLPPFNPRTIDEIKRMGIWNHTLDSLENKLSAKSQYHETTIDQLTRNT